MLAAGIAIDAADVLKKRSDNQTSDGGLQTRSHMADLSCFIPIAFSIVRDRSSSPLPSPAE